MPEILPLLFDNLPAEWRDDYDRAAPWSLLGEPLDRLLSDLPEARIEAALDPEVRLAGDRIVVEKGCRIHPGATIHGPIYLGADCEIRPGAFLRGGCWLGAGSIVGTNTEVKRAIFLPGARAPHLNYVGDSILGSGVNLGAGTILSNFRHDGAEIVLPLGERRLATGRRKLGAVLGDGVLTGCNSVLNPGTVVGRGTQIYTGVQLRSGVYPAEHRIKLRQELDVVEQR